MISSILLFIVGTRIRWSLLRAQRYAYKNDLELVAGNFKIDKYGDFKHGRIDLASRQFGPNYTWLSKINSCLPEFERQVRNHRSKGRNQRTAILREIISIEKQAGTESQELLRPVHTEETK